MMAIPALEVGRWNTLGLAEADDVGGGLDEPGGLDDGRLPVAWHKMLRHLAYGRHLLPTHQTGLRHSC